MHVLTYSSQRLKSSKRGREYTTTTQGGLGMKIFIPFILFFGIVLGACNGQYNNDKLTNHNGEQDTNGEQRENNGDKQEEDQWKIKETTTEDVYTASAEEAKFLVRDYLDILWTEDTAMEIFAEENDHYLVHVYEDFRSENDGDKRLTRGILYINKDTSQISMKTEQNAEVSGFASEPVKNLAMRMLYALDQKDMKDVAAHVDKEKGLLFSPYLYIRSESLIFTPDEVEHFFADTNEYVWGHFDGKGDPIEKIPEVYYDRFIYVEDFIEADEVVYNEIVGRGNLQSNINEVFDEIEFVEYYVSGSDEYDGMDWRSLILVFDTSNNERPVLVAIIHNQWTI